MLDWLKTILGDTYTEEIDKKVSNEIGKEFVSRADFNQVNEAKKTLDGQVKDRDTQLETLKKASGNNEELKKQINDLQEANKTAKEKYESDLKATRLSSALDLGITKAKGKSAKAIKALLDTSKLSLKDDGTVDGLDTSLEALKKSDGYLFEQVETKPEGNGFHAGVPDPNSPAAKTVADAFAAARGNF